MTEKSDTLPFAKPERDSICQSTARSNNDCRLEGIAQAVELATRVARSSASVLVTGESGTGKEVICQLIHKNSDRSERPLICVNCAALPESLIESELFGHRKGAFTGADYERVGLFEAADGGTLMLDEISEIPVSIQAKLLRVLETQSLTRIGTTESIDLDVRILATSNRALDREVAEGRFRIDLFHRLKVIGVDLPALRFRIGDIVPLAKTFLTEFGAKDTETKLELHPSAVQRLQSYHWPGNVRELRNVMHRAVILADGPVVMDRHLGDFDVISERAATLNFGSHTLAEIEKSAILAAMEQHRGNRTLVAQHLGVSTKTIFNKLQLYARKPAPENSPEVFQFPGIQPVDSVGRKTA